MRGAQRREEIMHMLKKSRKPLSGQFLSEKFSVTRQSIVHDIEQLRQMNLDIISTNKGYLLNSDRTYSRVFKLSHSDEEIEDELFSIIDLGGVVIDVFVKHKAYGELRAPMGIASRRDISEYVGNIKSGKSTALKNVTSNYHYHTVEAPSEQILDLIQAELEAKHYLAEYLDYEYGEKIEP